MSAIARPRQTQSAALRLGQARTRWISGAVFSDVTAIQKNGKKTTMAPPATASATSQRTWTGPRFGVAGRDTAVLQYSTGFRKIRHCSSVTTISVTKTKTAMTEASPKRKNLNAVS